MRLRTFWALPTVFFAAAVALPYGCGSLGILNITSARVNESVWTCAGIDPKSLYTSGQNYLYAAATKSNASACGNYCADWSGVNAAVWYHNSTCGCWGFGNINTSPSVATSTESNATFIDFYETGRVYGPNPAQYWGKFTCPQGAQYNTGYWGNVGGCWPLTIVPGKAFLGRLPYSFGSCRNACLSLNGQWVLVNSSNTICDCYGDFVGLKTTLNYSSPYIFVDLFDFVAHPTSSTSSTKATSTSTKTSTKTATTSSTKTSTKASTKANTARAAC